jgi:hypothetical protein
MRRNKREFSKLLVLAIVALCFSFVIWCMHAMEETGDLSPIAYLAPSLCGVLAATAIGYFSRAKAKDKADLQYEKSKQLSKLKQQYGEDFYLYREGPEEEIDYTGGA